MSHRGQGVHGEWIRQASTSYSRVSQIHGHAVAWRLTVGRDNCPPVPVVDVYAAEKRAARQVYTDAVKTAKQSYSRRGRKLTRAYQRGAISLAELWRLDDEAFRLCESRQRNARLAMHRAIKSLDWLVLE